MEKQQTLVRSSSVSGIALHTGARATVRIQPAPENTGIIFRRVDLPGKPEVRPLTCNVVDVRRGTTIADGKAIVFTVEHIMSALNAWHIDNCIVEMDGMEPPIVDGSSLPYFEMIREAGVAQQEAPALTFTPSQPVYVEGGYTRLVMIPGEGPLRISCLASFKGCPIDPQFHEFTLDTEARDRSGAHLRRLRGPQAAAGDGAGQGRQSRRRRDHSRRGDHLQGGAPLPE